MNLVVHLRGRGSMSADENSIQNKIRLMLKRICQALNIGNLVACAECGAPARIKGDGVVRACKHSTAGIVHANE